MAIMIGDGAGIDASQGIRMAAQTASLEWVASASIESVDPSTEYRNKGCRRKEHLLLLRGTQ